MRAVGIGQCSWDLLALSEGFPKPDTKHEIGSLSGQGGGPVATAMVALARLGARCSFHGVAGDDEYGPKIAQSLLDEGVDASGLVMRSRAGSQVAFILVEPSTQRRTIIWRRPTAVPLGAQELPEGFLDGSDILLLDGLMSEVSLHAARMAKGAGVPVLLDAGRMRPGMMELAAMADHVVGSEEFARDIGMNPDSPEDFHQKARSTFPGLLTITLGKRGCISFPDAGPIHVPAYDLDVLDTTGAGDVFHAGYAYGVMRGLPLVDTLKFASALAALKCRSLGGRAGIPTLDEAVSLCGISM